MLAESRKNRQPQEMQQQQGSSAAECDSVTGVVYDKEAFGAE